MNEISRRVWLVPLALPARPSERDPPQTVCARNCAIHLLLHAPMHNAEKHKAGDASRKIDRSMKIRLHSSSPRELEITFHTRVCVCTFATSDTTTFPWVKWVDARPFPRSRFHSDFGAPGFWIPIPTVNLVHFGRP